MTHQACEVQYFMCRGCGLVAVRNCVTLSVTCPCDVCWVGQVGMSGGRLAAVADTVLEVPVDNSFGFLSLPKFWERAAVDQAGVVEGTPIKSPKGWSSWFGRVSAPRSSQASGPSSRSGAGAGAITLTAKGREVRDKIGCVVAELDMMTGQTCYLDSIDEAMPFVSTQMELARRDTSRYLVGRTLGDWSTV